MAPLRPRRSTAAPTDYSQFMKPPLSSSDSSNSSDDDNHDQPQPSTSAHNADVGKGKASLPSSKSIKDDKEKKKRKKTRAMYIPSGSSGSEFDAGNHSTSDSDHAGTGEDDDDASASDGQGEGGGRDSDLSGSIAGSEDEPMPFATSSRGYNRRGGGGGGRGKSGGGGGGGRKREEVLFAPSSSAARPNRPGRDPPTRACPPRNWPESGWDTQYPSCGPLATALPSMVFSKGRGGLAGAEQVLYGAGSVGKKQDKGKGKEKSEGEVGTSDAQAGREMEHWTGHPFLGPGRGAARDLAWAPGRWVKVAQVDGDEEQGRVWREAEKWGGWYEGIEGKEGEEVSEADLYRSVSRQLPTLYQPSEPFSISAPLPGSSIAQTALGPSSSQVQADAIVEDEEDLPIASGSAATANGNGSGAAGSVESGPQGRLTLLLGGIKGVEDQEQEREEAKVELERFEAVRMDAYYPRKPAHMFNAGGPVNSLAWAPRPRSAQKEYLALSTLATLDSPLKHTPSPFSPALAASPAFHGHLFSSSSTSASTGDTLPTPPLPGTMIQIWSLNLPSSGDVEEELSIETTLPEGAMAEDSGPRKEIRGMRFEMGLVIGEGREGDAWDLQWCPFGGTGKREEKKGGLEDPPISLQHAMDIDQEAQEGEGKGEEKGRLGILAGVFRDGSIALFEVPRPREERKRLGKGEGKKVFVTTTPLLKLRLPNTSLFSLSWASHRTIAGGCSNGWIAVWDVAAALESGWNESDPPPRPTHYFPAHSSVIRSLTFVPTPPPSISFPESAQDYDHHAEPTGLVSTGYDGSTVLSDLRNPAGMGGAVVLDHERSPSYAVAFCPHTGCVYISDSDDRVKALYLKPGDMGSVKRIAPHRGAVLSIATSPHHPFIIATSTDGSASLTNGMRAMRKRRVRGHFTQRLCRVEINRNREWEKGGEDRKEGGGAGEREGIRVWEGLDIEYRQALDPTNFISLKQKQKTIDSQLDEEELRTPAWPEAQAILKATWHPALERAGLLAIGGAGGWGRVEWVEEMEV
ncbi:hypothetical protein JCM11641_006206 [Rhodosporidiobolus odoratus]